MWIRVATSYPGTFAWDKAKILDEAWKPQEKVFWKNIEEYNVKGCHKCVTPSLEERNVKY